MFVQFNLTVDQQALNYGFPTGVGFAAIMQEWANRAGPILIFAIREVLGHDALYTLSLTYAANKIKSSKFKRVAGKDPEQPLILSGEHIYDALEFHATSDGLIVMIPDSKSHSDSGFPIAEYWEAHIEYLEAAYASCKNLLEEELVDVILENLGLK